MKQTESYWKRMRSTWRDWGKAKGGENGCRTGLKDGGAKVRLNKTEYV